jgi:glucosamine--fructose-6-phosphate aminotransferase (isomerizing)
MCGIVGYVGSSRSVEVLLGGLRRLEYRGYDSAGIAVIDDAGELNTRKRAGKLRVLTDELAESPINDGGTGIGHTRWASSRSSTTASSRTLPS